MPTYRDEILLFVILAVEVVIVFWIVNQFDVLSPPLVATIRVNPARSAPQLQREVDTVLSV